MQLEQNCIQLIGRGDSDEGLMTFPDPTFQEGLSAVSKPSCRSRPSWTPEDGLNLTWRIVLSNSILETSKAQGRPVFILVLKKLTEKSLPEMVPVTVPGRVGLLPYAVWMLSHNIGHGCSGLLRKVQSLGNIHPLPSQFKTYTKRDQTLKMSAYW